MKKSIKRFLLTIVVMLCSMSALAEYYTGSYGTNVTWSLDTETGLLKIMGSGEMKDYSVGNAPWYSYRSSITIAEISDGITSIGESAFKSCSELTELTSKAAVPPSMGSFVFSRETVRAGTLYVPAESVEAYKLASEWSDWGTIKAICFDILDDVPSSLVNEQKTFENVSSDIPFDGEEETYDLQGRRTGSHKGLNIIRRQDGSVRKVLR